MEAPARAARKRRATEGQLLLQLLEVLVVLIERIFPNNVDIGLTVNGEGWPVAILLAAGHFRVLND